MSLSQAEPREKNREIPMNVLDEGVKPILWKLCENKKADEFVFVNPKSKKPYTDVKRVFGTACELAEVRNLEWHDLRATFVPASLSQVMTHSRSKN
jgi:hypothetical protein